MTVGTVVSTCLRPVPAWARVARLAPESPLGATPAHPGILGCDVSHSRQQQVQSPARLFGLFLLRMTQSRVSFSLT